MRVLQYGDLGAMTAAIMLDREARSDTIEADPSHGKIREPFLKILGMMRSMEYSATDNTPILLTPGACCSRIACWAVLVSRCWLVKKGVSAGAQVLVKSRT